MFSKTGFCFQESDYRARVESLSTQQIEELGMQPCGIVVSRAAMKKALVHKAVVYCVRDGHLLVFRHLDAPWHEVGLQVPSGTIRDGEPPEDAALRELREEAGHDGFAIEAFLGTADYDITPYRAEVQRRHFHRARPTDPLPDRWRSAEAHDGTRAPTRLECFWIPLRGAHVLQAGQGALLWRLVDEESAAGR
jgi:ADP-ribose pyrophosphatase YjhB (NUDIX family)